MELNIRRFFSREKNNTCTPAVLLHLRQQGFILCNKSPHRHGQGEKEELSGEETSFEHNPPNEGQIAAFAFRLIHQDAKFLDPLGQHPAAEEETRLSLDLIHYLTWYFEEQEHAGIEVDRQLQLLFQRLPRSRIPVLPEENEGESSSRGLRGGSLAGTALMTMEGCRVMRALPPVETEVIAIHLMISFVLGFFVGGAATGGLQKNMRASLLERLREEEEARYRLTEFCKSAPKFVMHFNILERELIRRNKATWNSDPSNHSR